MGFVFSMQLQCNKLSDGTSLILYTHRPSTYGSLLPRSLTITRHVWRHSHLQCHPEGSPCDCTGWPAMQNSLGIEVDTNTTNHTLQKPDKVLCTSFITNLFEHMLPLKVLQKSCAACSLMTGLSLMISLLLTAPFNTLDICRRTWPYHPTFARIWRIL